MLPRPFREIWILAPRPFREIWGPGPASLPGGQCSGHQPRGSGVVVLWVSAYNASEWFTSAPWYTVVVHCGSALGVSGSAVHSIQRK